MLALSLIAGSPAQVLACFGTPAPPRCAQTIWLAKYVPTTIVNPGTGSDIVVPIGLVPYVSWESGTLGCAQPVAATVSLTITCTPAGGGTAIAAGTYPFTLTTPTSPGAQPVGGALGGSVTVTIPAGTIPAGSFSCTVVGTYTVNFGSGVGAGDLVGGGDTEFCIVEPSPSDTSLPRLDLRRLDLGDGGFTRCLRGGQAPNFYFIANNDPDSSVTFDFTSDNEQTAVMPSEGDSATIFAISNPTAPDPFFQSFPGDLKGGIIPDGDPAATGAGRVEREITLGPMETTIVQVLIRSSAMCANGSCGEVVTKLEGTWDDGSSTPALACAGTVSYVDDSLEGPKTPLCPTMDCMQVDPNSFANWGYARFDNSSILVTHAAGNAPFSNTNTSGQNAIDFFSTSPADEVNFHPQMACDHIRTIMAPSMVEYEVGSGTLINDPKLGTFAQNHFTQVIIDNLPDVGEVMVPLIHKQFNPGAPTETNSFQLINIDATNNLIVVEEMDNLFQPTGNMLYSGNFATLIETPPAGLVVNMGTTRTFTKSAAPVGGIVTTDPYAATRLENIAGTAESIFTDGFESGDVSAWTATVPKQSLISLEASSGAAGEDIQINVDAANIPLAPDTAFETVTVTTPTGLNAAVFPIALRGFEAGVPPVLVVSDTGLHFSSAGGVIASTLPLTVTNGGGGVLDWTAEVTQGAEWIDITVAKIEGSGTIDIIVQANEGPDRQGTIAVTDASATNSPVQITVSQTAAAAPLLSASPTSLNVAADGGTETIDVTNAGGATIDWTAALLEAATWIDISSAKVTGDGSITVTVEANEGESSRNATIRITDSGASNSPQDVVVTQAGTSTQGNPGDINSDGDVNASDIQLVINDVLGIDIGALSADLNDDGVSDAVDVQLIINIVLGV
jgi:hypothetical protein